MSFLAPGFLAVAALGLIVLAFHVHRRRAITVPSLLLWSGLQAPDAAPRQRLRAPKPSVLLFLQLGAMAAFALALAQPILGVPRPPEHWIFVVDGSASMQVRDTPDGTRFEAAVRRVAELAAGAGADNLARVSLIEAGVTPAVAMARQDYRAASLEAALRDLTPTDGAPDWTGTADLVAGLQLEGDRTRVILLTDRPLPDEFRVADTAVEVIGFGTAGPNAGLRATVTPIDQALGLWKVAGEVVLSGGPRASVVTLQFTPDGAAAPLDWATIPVGRAGAEPAEPGDPPIVADFEREVEIPGQGILTVRLPADAASYDDAARFALQPSPSAFDVLYLGAGEQPVVRALQSTEGVRVFQAEALPDDLDRFALVVVDGVEVARWPETNTLWIGRGRIAGSAEPAALADPDPSHWRNDHFLARGVQWPELGLAAAFDLPAWDGGDVLLAAGRSPLIQARTGAFGREVALAFDPRESDWPQHASFPAFVARLVAWTGSAPGTATGRLCEVGAPCSLDARLIGGVLEALGDTPAPTQLMATRMSSQLAFGRDASFVPERAGAYRLSRDGRSQVFTVNAPVGQEGELAGPPGSAETEVGWPVPLWPVLGVVLLLLLLVEGVAAGMVPARFLSDRIRSVRDSLIGRRRLVLGLRIATLGCLLAALAGLPVPRPSAGENVVLGVLVAPGDEAAEVGGPAQRMAVVELSAEPRVLRDFDTAGTVAGGGTTVSSDGAALLLAAAMLPADRPGRIVVDNRHTPLRGESRIVFPDLVNRGIAVDVLDAATPAAPRLRVHSVEGPAVVYQGDAASLTAVVGAPAAGDVVIEVLRDGEVISTRTAELSEGFNRIEVAIPEVPAGRSLYEVRAVADGEPVTETSRAGVVIEAESPGPVAVLSPDPEVAAAMVALLEQQGLDAAAIAPDRVPLDIDRWLGYRAILSMNVPALAVTTYQQNLIETAVAEHGIGLFIAGGDTSFGPGGYLETALDRMSPLSSRVPRMSPEVAMAFVLDRSGSMQQLVGDSTRLDVARRATIAAIGFLDPRSQVSVTVFDENAYTVVPLQTIASGEQVAEVLGRIGPGGGTSIFPGLVHALRQLRGAASAAKHVVVMTDGLTQPGDFPGVLAQMREAGITVSGVAIGSGSGAWGSTVADIAERGGGAYHAATDIEALPSILSQEAMMLSGAPLEEGTTEPQWVDRSASYLDPLPATMPPIDGFVLSTTKPGADLALVTPDREGTLMPLLAQWRFGNGQVIALTTEAVGGWTSAWQELEGYPAFWAQAMRSILAGNASPRLWIGTTRQADTILVDVETIGDAAPTLTVTGPGDTGERELRLAMAAPGSYRGSFVANRPGDYALTATSESGSAGRIVHISFPAILDPALGGDAAPFLAAATGGARLGPDDPLQRGGGWSWRAEPRPELWLLAALALFMADLAVRYARNLTGLGLFSRRPRRSNPTPAPVAGPNVIV